MMMIEDGGDGERNGLHRRPLNIQLPNGRHEDEKKERNEREKL